MTTIMQRGSKVGLKLTKIHRRIVEGEMRICVYVNGKRMTWRDMLTLLHEKEKPIQ